MPWLITEGYLSLTPRIAQHWKVSLQDEMKWDMIFHWNENLMDEK
jgi:hypothetical protein